MDNEIKEILNNLKEFSIEHCHHDYDYTFTKKEIELLLDYISNLQDDLKVYKNLVDKKWEGN